MRATPTWILVPLFALALIVGPIALAAGSGEAEARAAFERLVQVAGKQQLGEFKKLVAKADLREMEAMEKEHAGLFQMMMEMIAADDPKDFTLEIKGKTAVFVKRVEERGPELTSTQTTKVHLLREDNQWKFGKPGR